MKMDLNIQMVDLQKQYLKIKNEVDEAVQGVIDNASFIKGPAVKSFENNLAKYLGVNHVIGCANGTDALQLAMMALDLKPGDEIITSNFTFIATVEVVKLLGLSLKLVDVDPETFNITPAAIERAISPKTKAIVPVHLFGQICDMTGIMELAEKYKLYVIEDTAQANGATYNYKGKLHFAGTIGHIGCTSFFPSKNLGCFGDGGALLTNDDQLASKIRSIANHGMTTRYYHDDIGINSRLDSIQAAILDVKLKYLDGYNQARQNAADKYDKQLSGIKQLTLPIRKNKHIFHQYTIQVSQQWRDSLKKYLEEHQVPCMVYYPVPIHKQKAYYNQNSVDADFPVTLELCQSVLSLPMHTELDTNQINYICETIKDFFKQHG